MYKEVFDRLPDNYSGNNQTNNEKLHWVVFQEVAELRQVFSDIKHYQDMDNAWGKTLDHIGRNVLELRNTEDDDLYRQYIKTKIIANLSQGDIETINQVASFLIGDDYLGVKEVWDDENYNHEPAALAMNIKEEMNLLPEAPIGRVVAGGVRLFFEMTLGRKLLKFKSLTQGGFSRFPLCNTIRAGTWHYQQNVGKIYKSLIQELGMDKGKSFNYPETALVRASEELYAYHQFAQQKNLNHHLFALLEGGMVDLDYVLANLVRAGEHPERLQQMKTFTEGIGLTEDLEVGTSQYPVCNAAYPQERKE